jgi:hypothetical protein
MTQEPFIQPRFVGPRFAGHTLPLSAAKDLAAYEELVLELAKHLFRQKNQDRVRLPKGFASGFSLHIERIDDGSAKPALVAMMLAGQLFSDLPAEITEAKDLINSVIATEATQPFPAVFPKDFYSYFNRIGRSLEDGESIEWLPDSPTNKTVLTPIKRKRLVLAHRETYEAEVNVVGLVEVLNTNQKTGVLRALEKEPVAFVYDDPFFSDLKGALGLKAEYVRVLGVGEFDVNERLGSITKIDQLERLPHYPVTAAIDKLANLSDGWLEGVGVAPKPEDLNWLTNAVASAFPESLDYPSVAPTEEGNVILEWILPKARIELEVNFAAKQLELYASYLDSDNFMEKTFGINRWQDAFGAVEGLLLI